MTAILSIVIATRNRHLELRNCLNSISKSFSNVATSQLEVVIVDQSDDCFDPADFRKINARYLRHAPGASRARNYGAKIATGKFLWFLDDDAEVTSFDLGLLDEYADIHFVKWKERNIQIPRKKTKSYNLYQKILFLRNTGAPMFVVARSTFLTIGGFNENIGPGAQLPGGEDADLMLRLHKRAYWSENCIGEFSHSIEQKKSEKLYSYAYCRGEVLLKNSQYDLFFFHIFYYIYLFIAKKDLSIFYFLKSFKHNYANQ